jgi:S1-C subfamily serine protease
MSKDPRKWIIAVCIAVVVILAVNSSTIYQRFNPESIISQVSLVSLIKRVEPSVVYIETVDDYGDRLWSGSGVIIYPDGLVLTAGHVVDGATAFKIVLPDGQEFWSNKSYYFDIIDVGLIQIDAEKLPFSYLGNSDNLCKGEEVFIMGSSLGFDLFNTVTSGIISGLKRDIGFFGEKLMIQSDAQSWPGNSGGPVYNMNGRIVGILVGGYWGADGISLCIPTNICKLVINCYMAEKELENAR